MKIELENHGRFKRLSPGDSLVYRVRWNLKKVPSNTTRENLLKLVEELIK
jgi:hypothetical protein